MFPIDRSRDFLAAAKHNNNIKCPYCNLSSNVELLGDPTQEDLNQMGAIISQDSSVASSVTSVFGAILGGGIFGGGTGTTVKLFHCKACNKKFLHDYKYVKPLPPNIHT